MKVYYYSSKINACEYDNISVIEWIIYNMSEHEQIQD